MMLIIVIMNIKEVLNHLVIVMLTLEPLIMVIIVIVVRLVYFIDRYQAGYDGLLHSDIIAIIFCMQSIWSPCRSWADRHHLDTQHQIRSV